MRRVTRNLQNRRQAAGHDAAPLPVQGESVMRVVALSILVFVAGLTLAAPARAELYLGLAVESGLFGVNIELAGPVGSVYAVLGSYQGSTGYEFENMTGFVGLRRFQDGKFNEDGYFGGVFVGDIGGGTDYNRFGLGGELGYQWLTSHLRMTLQAGMALMGDGSGKGAPETGNIEPAALLGASISMRF